MTRHLREHRRSSSTAGWLLPLLFGAVCGTAWAQPVTLHLRSGDRVSGWLVSQATNQLVISNAWAGALPVPLAAVLKCETNPAASAPTAARDAAGPPAKPVPGPAPKLAVKPADKPPGTLQGLVRFGFNALFHTKEQQNYFADLKLTYERPYESDPNKRLRNTTEVRGDYQRTDGQQSANRARGSNKSDVDIWQSIYAYGLGGAGFDEERKIDFQYQVGPGVGHRLCSRKDFTVNVEGGVSYEAEYRTDLEGIERLFLRLGLNSTWQISPKVKLTQQLAFYPDLVDEGQFHNEFSSNVSYGLWKQISLNLSLLDDYNTDVAPGVEQNRFEIRSSLGYTF